MRHRLDYLDGLRAFAALAVVVQHSIEITTASSQWAWPILKAINLGLFGVVLFFLVSGFVIPFSFSGPTPIRSFARSRVFRIVPAFWLSIAVGIVLTGFPGVGNTMINMLFLARPLGAPEVSGVHWTLAFEAGFYVFCAVAYARGWLDNPKVIIRILAVLLAWCVLAKDEWRIYFCFMLTGLLLRMAFIEDKAEARQAWPFICALIMIVAGFVGWKPAPHPFLTPEAKLAANLLPVPIFLATIWLKPKVPGWLLYLGAISFSVYLFQDLALTLCRPLVDDFPLAYPVAVIALTIAIASVTYRYVEKPFNRMGKRGRSRPLAEPQADLPVAVREPAA
ncbi:MAG: acyltransferase [Novosphingobium sp.]|nr:acyltransferase [Novosphingobium sp.]